MNSLKNKNVKLSSLTEEVQKAIERKGQSVEIQVLGVLKETANNTLLEVNRTAPRSKRNVQIHLADTFKVEEERSGLKTRYKIYSKEKGPLVHLVEFGFRHYGKKHKYVKGQPFMIPSLEHNSVILVDKVKKIIKQ